MPQLKTASIEVRRACWAQLWQILLREPSIDDPERRETEPGSEVAETNNPTARAPPGKEVAKSVA